MNRRVCRAVLHDGLFIPGVGNVGKTLNNYDTQFTYRDIDMEWESGSGLIWRYKNRCGLIPAATVSSVEFAPEDKPPTPSPKSSKVA